MENGENRVNGTDTGNSAGVPEETSIRSRRLGETLPILYLEAVVLVMAGQMLGGILVGIFSICLGSYIEQIYDVWYTASI